MGRTTFPHVFLLTIWHRRDVNPSVALTDVNSVVRRRAALASTETRGAAPSCQSCACGIDFLCIRKFHHQNTFEQLYQDPRLSVGWSKLKYLKLCEWITVKMIAQALWSLEDGYSLTFPLLAPPSGWNLFGLSQIFQQVLDGLHEFSECMRTKDCI